LIIYERTTLIALLGLCIVALSAPYSHAQTADETARELSNPASSLASLANKFEYRWYDGDLPGAGAESGFRYIFQPAFPFPRENGDKIIFRPAFNVPIDEPYFDADKGDFRSGGGFGDIGFDLVYAPKTDNHVSWGAGIVGGLPTGTNKNLRGENWTLGPEIFAAYIDTWGLVGAFATHSTKIAGDGLDTNLSTLQYFYFASLGGGWQLGAGPTISYNWEATSDNRWNVPVGMGVSKTTSLFGRPLKLNVEVDYSVIRPDVFGVEWLLKFSFTPVITNPFN
jgi:hypothetical protein